MKRIIIAAVSENGVIGKGNEIPWRIPEELRFFRETTMGFPILMGRKTFESIGKILDGRTNIVLSKTVKQNEIDGAKVFSDITSAEKLIAGLNVEKYFVIGGASVFKQLISSADELIISRIKRFYEGDVFFPEISNNFWEKVKELEFEDFTVCYFLKR